MKVKVLDNGGRRVQLFFVGLRMVQGRKRLMIFKRSSFKSCDDKVEKDIFKPVDQTLKEGKT